VEVESVNERLSGRVAIITGAGSGIGAATAEALAGLGMRLALVGRRQSLIEAVAERIRVARGEAIALAADVRIYDDQARVVRETVERYERVDVFIANAAVADFGPIHEADPEVWRDVITTNVLGVMYGVRAVLPAMYANGSGHIVIVSSGSGRTTYVGEPAYVASKHATVAFADCLRMEVAPRGLRVTLIEPGLVETPLIHVWEGSDDLVVGVTPLDPVDVAGAIRYALEQPAYSTVFEIALRPTSQI
jgi:NADP-dependent 3-hydroxy acid dehydrogenase YdfG